jgi:hypothetical protein
VTEEPLDPADRHLVLATARDHGADLSGPLDDVIGFAVAVRRRLGLPPTDWTRLGHGDALVILDQRLDAARLAGRPGPRPADESVARALYSLRPLALPWSAIEDVARVNLTRQAGNLRRALEHHGWTAPAGGR